MKFEEWYNWENSRYNKRGTAPILGRRWTACQGMIFKYYKGLKLDRQRSWWKRMFQVESVCVCVCVCVCTCVRTCVLVSTIRKTSLQHLVGELGWIVKLLGQKFKETKEVGRNRVMKSFCDILSQLKVECFLCGFSFFSRLELQCHQ
jgi:hypothetical protein